MRGGESLSISWGASTDEDGNLSGYILERQVNGGAWAQVYKGINRSYTDAITFGWTSIAYRVKAYDSAGAESAYQTSATRTVVNNHAPGQHHRRRVGEAVERVPYAENRSGGQLRRKRDPDVYVHEK